MSDAMRVVIADDNYLVREGVRRLLEDSGDVEVVAAVGSAPELLDAVDRFLPTGVLTDIRMPPGHDRRESEPPTKSVPAIQGLVSLSCLNTQTRRMPPSC